ncbi:MAG: precorrin-2 C(20)-methyltransferase, partial [Rhodospirillaceae bacterium]|nr:precorrin-2 C(20)-methyltransferase [Rhodospirillaceae bacterium]
MNNKIGILTGLGLGPGDPSLMTVAARELLSSVTVVAYIHANGKTSIARKIANDFILSNAKEIAIPVDMSATQDARRRAYDGATAEIIAELSCGNDVAFLCEGDPLFYGSFVHLAEKVAENTNDDFTIKSIPGVSSIHAAATAASISLASDNETFSIIPATLGETELGVALARPGAMAIIKIGSNLEKLKRLLKLNGRLDGVTLVTSASTSEEKIENLADVSNAPYFSLALVPAISTHATHPPKGIAIVVVNKAGFSAGAMLKNA